MKAVVEVKYRTLIGTTKGSAIVPLEIEVEDGTEQKVELTPQQLASTLALRHFIQNYVVSEGDIIEIRSVRIL
jgi:hypothetical protein